MIVVIGPDEQIYAAQAAAVRMGGIQALRDLAAEYVEEPTLAAYPSPLRWLWIALTSLTAPLGPQALQYCSFALLGPAAWWLTGSWVAAILGATSPLALTLSRHRLQDVPVALVTLLGLGTAMHHSAVGLAIAIACLLSLKEAALLAVPAMGILWWRSGGPLAPGLVSIALGLAAWGAALALLFGSKLPALFRASLTGHKTEYAKDHQVGAAHRLLVDLVMVSPLIVMVCAEAGPKVVPLLAALVWLLAAHSLAPIRNLRFIVAGDILARVIAAFAIERWWEVAALVAIDALIFWRIRHIYDPVTQALATALGMVPSQQNKK